MKILVRICSISYCALFLLFTDDAIMLATAIAFAGFVVFNFDKIKNMPSLFADVSSRPDKS